jgi:hypothetical protein
MVQASIGTEAQVLAFIDKTSLARRLLLVECVQPRSQEKKVNIQALSQVPVSRLTATRLHGFCPSSQFCLARVLLWAVINFGTIAPAMT